jgi:uncharacterized membrane protein (DUF4010 family)
MFFQVNDVELFYSLFIKIVVSFFCGFIIGIERTRVSAQYGARDHIFFSMIATTITILYKDFFFPFAFIILFFGGMICFLIIGSIYRLFRENDPGYTTTLSMILSIIVGILCNYNEYLAIAIAVVFLIILSMKKQFNKIKTLQEIEWTGTIEFIAIVVLLFILIPNDLMLFQLSMKPIIIVFITILAVKYFSYFILKSGIEKNLYYISILGGFAHSEATTVELAEAGAPTSSIWLLIQTMFMRMLIVLLISPLLLYYAIYPILVTSIIGLVGGFLLLRNKETRLKLEKIQNPISLKGAFIFAVTYLLAVVISVFLGFVNLNIIIYYIVVFFIGLLSGGASSLFVAATFQASLINVGNGLIMLTIGLSAATLNKLFYTAKYLKAGARKKTYIFTLLLFISITIFLLVSMTVFTINIFILPIF